MSREALLMLLGERIGVDPGSLGERVLDHSFEEARVRLDMPDLAALAARVSVDRAAMAALVEEVVVGETWFFRVPQQFDDMVRFARTTARWRRPLRVLSLPCASGEEAWSAAIALLEAGLAPTEFEVLGIDVSAALVARAAAGEYRGSALRIPAPRDPWLQPIDGGVAVADSVRRSVRFRVGNALDPNLLADEPPFDVAFCRNLLIYLTGDARERVLTTLRGGLAQPGLVLAGQAEVLPAMTHGFSTLPQASPLSYLFAAPAAPARPPVRPPDTPRPVARAPIPDDGIQVARRTGGAAAATRLPDPSANAIAVSPPSDEEAVALAQRLADAGDLEGARTACRSHLSRSPQDANAHLLLGIVESARGDFDAADQAFARVLFLDHHHLDALERRALIAERVGRDNDARRLRARALRSRGRASEVRP